MRRKHSLLLTFLGSMAFVFACSVTAAADDDWFEARSEHFTIVSNGREGQAKDTLEDLEQLRRLIKQIFPSQRVDGTKPAAFYLFKNEKSMRPFQPTRDGEREDWAGMFRPTPLRDILLVRADGKSDAVRRLAFSQYTYLLGSYDEMDLPVWLSNGLASFYANTEISSKRAKIGLMRDSYRRTLGEYKSIPIQQLFAVDRSSDYYRDLSMRPLFDAQSWALVHYILIGQLENNGPIRLGRFVEMLAQGRDPFLAFPEAMGKSAAEIDSDVAVYIRKRISQYLQVDLPPLEMDDDFPITKLDAADALAHHGQLYLAVQHYDEAEKALVASIEAEPDRFIAYEAMASLRDRQGKRAEATTFLERAIHNGSPNPHVHLRRAQRFVNEGDVATRSEEERAAVRDSLRQVIRDYPTLTDAARLFGFIALTDSEAREEGHRVVTEALQRSPGNPSLALILGQLHSRDGNYAAARMIYSELLERELDPAFNASIRRQYDYVDARIKAEAAKAAAAASASAAGTAQSSGDAETSPSPSSSSRSSEADPTMTGRGEVSAASNRKEIRGSLVRFDCTDGYRFVVAAGDLTYVLEVTDLRTVQMFDNGEPAGTRSFYCGPLDGPVKVRFVPLPQRPEGKERRGQLIAIDFLS